RRDAMPALPLELVEHEHLFIVPFDPAHVAQAAREHDARFDRSVSRVTQAHLWERTAPEGSPETELVAPVDANRRMRTRRPEPVAVRAGLVRECARIDEHRTAAPPQVEGERVRMRVRR